MLTTVHSAEGKAIRVSLQRKEQIRHLPFHAPAPSPRSASACAARRPAPLAQLLVQDQQTRGLAVSPPGSLVPGSRSGLRAITRNLNVAQNPMELLWFEPSEPDLTLPQACWASVAKIVPCAHRYFLRQISPSSMASRIRTVSFTITFGGGTREIRRDLWRMQNEMVTKVTSSSRNYSLFI